ncbi:DUF3734 domain-containing protein [Parvibaculum sp. MBR-TMA-1.3b-4.2]|jgi:NTE family protein
MAAQTPSRPTRKPPSSTEAECPVLVLQGGGALGAYQAGVYSALSEAGIEPQWLAGISVGAINAAIIAGNRREDRVEKLKSFWDRVSGTLLGQPVMPGLEIRSLYAQASAASALAFGIPSFFTPRMPPPWLNPAGSPAALSFYDTAPLADTLKELVDFDRLNKGDMRFSVGAVNVRSGNFVYFDNHDMEIDLRHVMASGALPPGFPPVEIDGEHYWDGGIVSNTPLQYVLEEDTVDDMCVFQVDLFNARGSLPRTIGEVAERQKDIRYSSRTRLNTDVFRRRHRMEKAVSNLLEKLPPEFSDDPDVQALRECDRHNAITIIHLIHRRMRYHNHAKDYEFSRATIGDHWQAGRNDVTRTLRHQAWRDRHRPESGIQVFDLTRDATD